MENELLKASSSYKLEGIPVATFVPRNSQVDQGVLVNSLQFATTFPAAWGRSCPVLPNSRQTDFQLGLHCCLWLVRPLGL